MDAIGFPLSTVLAFLILAGGALLGDMLISRHIKTLTLSDAITRSVAYILVACLFGFYVWHAHGADAGSRFFAGFLMEKALSVDNLMVFAAIFTYFGVKSTQQRKLLQYGIVGAVVLRFIFVAGGMGLLLALGRATEVLFGILVAWSAWAILQGQEKEDVDYFDAWYIKAAHMIWPVYQPWLHGPTDNLFIKLKEIGRAHV
jgi:tellurite resistance protein TerC